MLPCSRYHSWPAVLNFMHSHHVMIPPNALRKACQNAGSRNVSSTGTMKEDSLSFLIHTEYALLAPT